MNVEIHLMGVDLSRRKCGCVRAVMSDWQHWWRYTRLRLAFRCVRGWMALWEVKRQVIAYMWICGAVKDHIVPIAVGMGITDVGEGLECVRKAEHVEEVMESWGKRQTFLGASKGHPEGIYAKNGSDMVCMTNDEWEHWYGRRGSSSGD